MKKRHSIFLIIFLIIILVISGVSTFFPSLSSSPQVTKQTLTSSSTDFEVYTEILSNVQPGDIRAVGDSARLAVLQEAVKRQIPINPELIDDVMNSEFIIVRNQEGRVAAIYLGGKIENSGEVQLSPQAANIGIKSAQPTTPGIAVLGCRTVYQGIIPVGCQDAGCMAFGGVLNFQCSSHLLTLGTCFCGWGFMSPI